MMPSLAPIKALSFWKYYLFYAESINGDEEGVDAILFLQAQFREVTLYG